MAFKPGANSWFALDNAAASLTVISPYIDDVSMPQTIAQLDVSAFGTTPKAFIPGLTDGDTIAFKGPYDATIHTQLTAIKTGQAAGSAARNFAWGPGGSVATQAKVTGTAWLASYTLSSGVAGRVDYAATLQITGAVTNSTF